MSYCYDASIESEILSQVSDVILNPPETEEYTTLKRCLLERFADSEEQRLKKLITDLDLGDKRPSHLLREMKELAGPHVNEGMVKSYGSNVYRNRHNQFFHVVLKV